MSKADLCLNGNTSATRALISLGRQDLIIMSAQSETVLLPGVEVVLNRDSTTDTLAGTDRPELLERCSANDGRLIRTCSLVNVVGTAVTGDLALLLSAGAGVVRAVRLDDVVFNQRVLGPAIDGHVLQTYMSATHLNVEHITRPNE